MWDQEGHRELTLRISLTLTALSLSMAEYKYSREFLLPMVELRLFSFLNSGSIVFSSLLDVENLSVSFFGLTVTKLFDCLLIAFYFPNLQ